MKIKFIGFLLSACLGISVNPVNADWSLDNSASSLFYVTSKASAVSEVNQFTRLDGALSNDGLAVLDIDLSSVDTTIEIRDERMKEHVFQIGQYTHASVSLNFDIAELEALRIGQSYTQEYVAMLNLHGATQPVTAEIRISKMMDSSIQADLVKPLIINAATFGMAEGVEALREIAGLTSINNNVAVDFSLNFKPE